MGMAATQNSGKPGLDLDVLELQATLSDPNENDFASLVFQVACVRAQFKLYRSDWDIEKNTSKSMDAAGWQKLLGFCDEYYQTSMDFGGRVARSLGSDSICLSSVGDDTTVGPTGETDETVAASQQTSNDR